MDDMDLAGDTSTTATLEIGGSVTSDIFGEGDVDFIALNAVAGQVIRIEQLTNIRGIDIDIVDAEGNVLATANGANRDGPIQFDPFFFTAPETGTFFLSVASRQFFMGTGFSSGEYTFAATEVLDDHGDTAETATQVLSDGSTFSGVLDTYQDIDTFTFNVGATEVVTLDFRIDLEGVKALGSFFIRVFDEDGNVLDGSVNVRDTQLQFTAEEAGAFTLQVEGFSSSATGLFRTLGAYEFSVTTSGPIKTINGTADDDVLTGTAGFNGRDDIFGFEGDDEIFGFGGDDALFGGEGNDRISAGNGDDTLFGGDGNDRLAGGNGNDFLTGEDGADGISGNNGDDDLFGGAGNDILGGGAGQDFIDGGTGNDRLFGGSGDDTLFGREGNDRLEGGDGNDFLNGQFGDDLLFGGEGNDNLLGNFGNDVLNGGDGDDRLEGGRGNDAYIGGAGADTFVISFSGGRNVVRDFEDGVDVFEVGRGVASSFEDFVIRQVNDDVVLFVRRDAANFFRLLDTDVNDIDASDFIFAADADGAQQGEAPDLLREALVANEDFQTEFGGQEAVDVRLVNEAVFDFAALFEADDLAVLSDPFGSDFLYL